MDNTWENEYKEARRSRLLAIYNIIDWLDFALIFLIVAYYTNASQATFAMLDMANANNLIEALLTFTPSATGLLLCLASLAVCVSAIIVAIMIQRSGANKSWLRLIVRFIIWGVWIPMDLYLIYMSLTGLAGL